MKKKIVFMLINMNIGGTEKALLNMLSEIPQENYEVTLLLLEKSGGFLNSIPKHVQVEYLTGYESMKKLLNVPPWRLTFDFLFSGKIIKGIKILFQHVLSRLLNNRSLFFSSLLKNLDSIEKQYDIAVAFAGPMDFISYFVINKIKAKRKVQWIHFDVTKIGFNRKFAAKIYTKFDKILVVSEEGKNKLIELLPSLKDKTDTFLNLVPKDSIRLLASKENGFEDNFKGIRILTVGRLAKEKGQDILIPVLAKLKNEGYNVRWYCIGDGNAKKEYEELINKYGLEDSFLLMGSKTNPYPFIKECDIYVQSSRHEGYCITLTEAKILLKPIITTNVNGAYEQIVNKKTGLIVNFNEDELYLAVKELIDNYTLRINFSKNLAQENYGSPLKIKKMFSLLEG